MSGKQETDQGFLEYQVQCPVCHNRTTVYHRAWASLVCNGNKTFNCKAEIVNPRADKDNKLSVVERAELELHNAALSLERAKRILGNKHSPV